MMCEVGLRLHFHLEHTRRLPGGPPVHAYFLTYMNRPVTVPTLLSQQGHLRDAVREADDPGH